MAFDRFGQSEYDALPQGNLPYALDAMLETPFGPVTYNIWNWLPGDLILSGYSGTKGSKAITKIQHSLGLGDHSEWTHVGVYVGRGQIWDLMPTVNVQPRSLRLFASGVKIKVVRPRDTTMILTRELLLSAIQELCPKGYFRVDTPWEWSKQLHCALFARQVLRTATNRRFLAHITIICPGHFAKEASGVGGHFADVGVVVLKFPSVANGNL
jgi:hypothetical protein